MVFYQNRVRNRFGPGSYKSGGAGRLIFTNKASHNDNRYIVGAQVGALNTSVRRALYRRANNSVNGPCKKCS